MLIESSILGPLGEMKLKIRKGTVSIHERRPTNEGVHKLCWDVIIAGTKVAKVEGLYKGVVMAKAKRKATADAVEILHRRYYAGKPQRLAALEQCCGTLHMMWDVVDYVELAPLL